MQSIKNNLKPVKKEHSDVNLRGGDGVADLHCTRVNFEDTSKVAVVSVWRCFDLDARKQFLENGEISVVVFGGLHPPISVVVGDYAGDIIKENKGNG